MLRSAGRWCLTTCFNPHPLREAGATRTAKVGMAVDRFQSSPTPRSGCYDLAPGDPVSILQQRVLPAQEGSCFNPHPLREAGATSVGRHPVSIAHRVSILTHSGSGCYLHVWQQETGLPCFNPHPLREAGATRCGRVQLRPSSLHVSILTHSEKRVLQAVFQFPTSAGHHTSGSSFNPHPLREAGATCAPS